MSTWVVRRRGEEAPLHRGQSDAIAIAIAEAISRAESEVVVEVVRDGALWCALVAGVHQRGPS